MLYGLKYPVLAQRAALIWLVGCTGSISDGHGAFGPEEIGHAAAGSGGAGALDGHAGESNADAEGGGGNTQDGDDVVDAPSSCATPQLVPRRVVRLDRAQLERTVIALLGEDAVAPEERVDPREREAAPLFAEGRAVNLDVLRTALRLAEHATERVGSDAAQLAGCEAAIDDACAERFLAAFTRRAYRRAASADELASVLELYRDVKAIYAGSSSGGGDEALRFAVQGVLSSPAVLYRTELGAPTAEASEAQLTPHELASLLSYFTTDGPPDAALLEAAASGKLDDDDGVRDELARLLETPAARANLTEAMLAHFELGQLATTRKDPEKFPSFTSELRESMYGETSRFVDNALWRGALDELITSRVSFVDERLAELYGVPYPGSSSGFVEVVLPEERRGGILTQASVLATRARTDETSIVSRGLYVNDAVLCLGAPPAPPSELQAEIDALVADGARSELDKAEYRAATQPCGGCHASIDPYGSLLERYDAIGRYRSQPLAISAVLPEVMGGGAIEDVRQLVQAAVQTETFSACMTKRMMERALTDSGALAHDDCSIARTHAAFLDSGRTFSELVTEVLASKTLTTRAIEPEP